MNEDTQAIIQRLMTKTVIPLSHIKVAHQWLENERKLQQSGVIFGDSGTGKSIVCEAYQALYRPKHVSDEQIVPVVYIQVMPSGTVKDLYTIILDRLNIPVHTGTVYTIQALALQTMTACKVETLIIDDAQHINSNNLQEVRNIYDRLNISIILVGTAPLDMIIKRDEQIHRRFRSHHRIEKLAGHEFKQAVEIWEQVLCLPTPSNLSSWSTLEILMKVTEGSIGLLDRILRSSAIESLKKGFTNIDLATCINVAKKYQ